MEFIHLHNHSDYSLLDGAASIDALISKAVEYNMPAVALTDHGVMFGAVEFIRKSKDAGIKPIIGCEFYVVPQGSRFEKQINNQKLKSGKGRGIYQHLVLLAKNFQGYKNLIKLTTYGHLEGFYYKPRIDLELIRKYSDGLIALSACQAGIVASHILDDDEESAIKTALIYKEIFQDDFYLEIQNHNLEHEKKILERMPLLAKQLGIKLIATNDIHYVRPQDAIAHNVLLLISEVSANSGVDYKNLKYQTDQLYFKSATEMCELFNEFPEAIKSTLEVNEKVENYDIRPKEPYLPNYPIPEDYMVQDYNQYLEELVYSKINERYPVVTAEIEARVKHELNVIKKMKYSNYFLVVQDFINAARRMGVAVGPGRGSAAGSVVSYILGIIDVDPFKYDLLFERFLNPERQTMPDIDIDFADNKRDMVIDYVKKKYGKNSVAQIITFGTLSSRAVIRDVGRVLGIELSVIDSISKLIPQIQGKVMKLEEALNTIPELKPVKESKNPKIIELIEISKVLEGLNRNASMHASGIVIAPGDISDYVPLYATPQTSPMTQYAMNELEGVGLLKMDFLGLRTLTINENTLKLVKENHKIDIDLKNIPEDDQKVFEIFQKGHTTGIFQFESQGMRESLIKLKPTSINELVAMNALYRPGPMQMIDEYIKRKKGIQKIQYLHPKMEPILKETYGVMVYQEQVIRIANEIAGLSLAEADNMRRAIGKKNAALMAKMKKDFINGAKLKGISEKIASDIYEMIEKFANYGFNKSHSVAYAVLAYQNAYLKTYYPVEFMTATMSAEIGNTDYIVELIEEAHRLGINILPPDVNESDVGFKITKDGIRFGLSAIKNVGVAAVEKIIEARESGKFKNIFDFCARVGSKSANKKILESLTMAGAFDSINKNRAQIFASIEKAIQFGQKQKENITRGQSNLFESTGGSEVSYEYPSMVDAVPWSDTEMLANEKKVLGFYISGHPLRKYEREIKATSNVKFSSLENIKDGTIVKNSGIVIEVKEKYDRNNKLMAFITVEDFTGKAEITVFSKIYEKYANLLKEDAMLYIIGRYDRGKILAEEFYPVEDLKEKFIKRLVISLDLNQMDSSSVDELKKILEKSKGKYIPIIEVNGFENIRAFRLDTKYKINLDQSFLEKIQKVKGVESIRFS
ncbi:MAG: DNA polymerase III alpha subunit [Ignavibacteriae bacterium]|nr:MAG: DNA polymerase III alpha subunit [Ignavibacteriota bacterium]